MSNQSIHDERRPDLVTYACAFLGTSFVLGMVRSLLAGGWKNPTSKVIGLCVLACITSLVVLALYNRRNWMRWVCVTLVAGGLAMLPWSIRQMPSNTVLAIHLAQAALQGLAALLLVLPRSNHWYARRNNA
jgi:protein-S-isoprenylcysteine O-methyltransferase Ste14